MWGQCDIDIEFDNPDRHYNAGDEVSGAVHVDVDKDCECDKLTVTAQWYTHGRGTPTSGREFTTVIAENEQWHAGSSHTYRFQFELPNGPCTYHGGYLNVDWSVEADIDISWSFDPEVEKDIIVEPATGALDTPYRSGNPDSGGHTDAESRSQQVFGGYGWATVVLVPFVVGGVAISSSAALMMSGESEQWLWVAIGIGITAVALWLLWKKVLRNKVATFKLGDIEARVQNSQISPGSTLDIEVDIPPKSEAHINVIRVGVRGWEEVTYRQGTNTKTATQDVYINDGIIDDSVDCRLNDGESASFEVPIPIPDDVPYSFHAINNHLNWAATIHVDIAGWPDWKTEIPFDMVPAVPDERDDQQARPETSPAGSKEASGVVW